MEVGRDNRRKITPRFKSCIEAVNQTLRNEGKLRKEFYMKKLKYFSILTVCFMTLSFTLVSCDLLYDSYDYDSNDYYTPSTPSTPSTPTTPTTLPGTYYGPNGEISFYTDGSYFFSTYKPIVYNYGSYSVSGSSIRLEDGLTYDVAYWTIVNSTSVRSNIGTTFTKK